MFSKFKAFVCVLLEECKYEDMVSLHLACLGFEQERDRFQSCIDRKGFGGCTVENRIIHSERVTIEDKFSGWLGTRQVDSTHTCVELISCVTDMLSVILHQIHHHL